MIYAPREDSFLLAEQVKKNAKGKKVLDVGCGGGIQMKTAVESGASEVLGVDIDDESVEFCLRQKLNVRKSNLFSKVKGKFDLIIFNPPYLPLDEREDAESSIATAGGKKGDEIILRFLKKVKDYLEKDGKILIVVSSLTPLEKIDEVIRKERFIKKVAASGNFFMEKLEIWELRN